AMAQILDYTPALQQNLEVDDSGNIYAGMLAGRYKVYIDPFWTGSYDYVVVGYKGTSQYDAGMFYCPYTPLELVRAVSPTTFQPAIGFKTRYGLVANPFTSLTSGTNVYYRKFKVINII
ncbi:MAG: ATP-binding protein, partial [Nanoarchaeota archaeon]|nr:ATP-binding protein [Nanoarchaeota archaeon]